MKKNILAPRLHHTTKRLDRLVYHAGRSLPYQQLQQAKLHFASILRNLDEAQTRTV